MNNFAAMFRGQFQLPRMMLALLASLVFVLPAHGHEWTLDGKTVKAKVIDFDRTHVLLQDQQGKTQKVAINELNATDLQYLTNLASIQNGQIQQQLARQQLQQQQTQLASQLFDVWTVNMVAPNGQIAWKNYFGENSLVATQRARQEFPNARITSVNKLRRGGINNNIGFNPIAPVFVPVVNRFQFGTRLIATPVVRIGF